MKKYAVFFFLLLFVGQLTAQRRAKMDPETRAKQETQMMTDSLALSAAQTEKVAEVNLTYAKKMAEARAEMRNSDDPDIGSMREKMRQLREEQEEAVNKYFTTEQAEKWKNIQMSRQSDRPTRRGNGKRDRRSKSTGQ